MQEFDADNTVFTLHLKLDRAGQLLALAGTAKFLPDEYLNNYMESFVEAEQYEEAGIMKAELESRKP